jgi:hypothetical protein
MALHRPIKLQRSLTPAEEHFFEEAEAKNVLFSFDEDGAPFVEMPQHAGGWFSQPLIETTMPHLDGTKWARYQLKDPQAAPPGEKAAEAEEHLT